MALERPDRNSLSHLSPGRQAIFALSSIIQGNVQGITHFAIQFLHSRRYAIRAYPINQLYCIRSAQLIVPTRVLSK